MGSGFIIETLLFLLLVSLVAMGICSVARLRKKRECTEEAGLGDQIEGQAEQLWQRRILMGERCQMPRFSGLILYDHRGRLLRPNSAKPQQENAAAPVMTLRDLL